MLVDACAVMAAVVLLAARCVCNYARSVPGEDSSSSNSSTGGDQYVQQSVVHLHTSSTINICGDVPMLLWPFVWRPRIRRMKGGGHEKVAWDERSWCLVRRLTGLRSQSHLEG